MVRKSNIQYFMWHLALMVNQLSKWQEQYDIYVVVMSVFVNIGENYGKVIIMKNENISVDIAKLPSRQTEVLIGCEPKVKSKHKILQKLFIKIFGYKLVFDKREAKILEIKAEDCPKVGVDSNLSIKL